jgi:hypothetical protein
MHLVERKVTAKAKPSFRLANESYPGFKHQLDYSKSDHSEPDDSSLTCWPESTQWRPESHWHVLPNELSVGPDGGEWRIRDR